MREQLHPQALRTIPSEIGNLAPFIALEQALTTRIGLLREHAPASDSVAALTRALAEVRTALTEARSGRRWVTVAEAARWTGLTEQAITYRCRTGFYLGAEKDGSLWRIPMACFGRKSERPAA